MTGNPGPPKVAKTAVDVAASTGAKAFVAWLDVIPTVANPVRTEAEHERAEHLAQVVDEQVEAIRQAKAPRPGQPAANRPPESR